MGGARGLELDHAPPMRPLKLGHFDRGGLESPRSSIN